MVDLKRDGEEDEAAGPNEVKRQASRRRGTRRPMYSLPFSEAELTPTAMRLLDAARRVFERSGVRALSYEAIGREADLSPSLIRYHFGSKSELLVALSAWLVYGDVQGDAWDALPRTPDHEQAIEMLLQDVRGVLEDLRSYELYYDLLPHMLRDEHTRGRLAGLLRGTIEPRAAALSGHPAGKAGSGDAVLLTAMSLALADGLAIQMLADPHAVDYERALSIWRNCVEGVMREGQQADPPADGDAPASS